MRLLGEAAERALVHALAAVGALIIVLDDFAVCAGGEHLDGALCGGGALSAAAADVAVEVGNAGADDAEVVQTGLDAVIGAAADADFELVRQLDLMPLDEELAENAVAEGLRVHKTVDADRTLAGDDRANDGAGTADPQTGSLHIRDQRLCVLVGNALNLDGETGGHCDAAVAVFFGGVNDCLHLLVGVNTVGGDNARDEIAVLCGNYSAALENLSFFRCDVRHFLFLRFIFDL